MGQSKSSTPDWCSSVSGHDPRYTGSTVWEHSFSRMKGGCCALRESREITGKLLLSREGGWSSHQRGHRSRRGNTIKNLCHAKLLAVAFHQGKMSQPMFVLQVLLPLTDVPFLHWLHSCKGTLLPTRRYTPFSLRYSCSQDAADRCHLIHNYTSA